MYHHHFACPASEGRHRRPAPHCKDHLARQTVQNLSCSCSSVGNCMYYSVCSSSRHLQSTHRTIRPCFAMRGYLAVSPPCCCSRSSPLQHTAMPLTSAGRLCGGLRRVLLSQLGAVERQSMQDMTSGSFRHMAIRAATKTEAPADANTSAKVGAADGAGVDVLTVASYLEGPTLLLG